MTMSGSGFSNLSMNINMKNKDFLGVIQDHQIVLNQLISHAESINTASDIIIRTLTLGNKLLLCGNGGSAADCQHFAAELMVRYYKNRRPYPAISLTTDSSILTAHTNDFSFESLFSRQVEALGNAEDCLIVLSTSGSSENVVQATLVAKEKNMTVIGLLGNDGGRLKSIVDIPIVVPSPITARIQEMHMIIYHWWCQKVDEVLE